MVMQLLRLWLVVIAVVLSLPCAAQDGTPLLFEVRSATTSIFLFGTIHVGTHAMYPLDPRIEEAYASSAALALEADPTDDAAAMLAITRSVYRPPDNLKNHVTPELYQALADKLPQIGLPPDHAHALKPHLLAMTLTMLQVQRLGYEPALGLDLHFAQRAKREGKPIVELESMAQQMDLFEALPAEVQEDMLRAALEALDDGSLQTELETLVSAWSSGDAIGIEQAIAREMESLDEQSARTLHEQLYARRNRDMAQKLREMLAGSTVHFVAVGAGHLIGESGLPNLLEAMGFSVQRW